MKRFLLLVFVLFFLQGFSQPYGNEWINFDQKYLKIPITQEGIYRINYDALDSAFNEVGEDISAINPKNLQVFWKGEEQYIYVKGEDDNVFHTVDYLEFYAKGNDGWLDERLYYQNNIIANPHYSLFNDTSAVFVTWNNQTNNNRLVVDAVGSLTGGSAAFFYKQLVGVGNGTYYKGEQDGNGKTENEYISGEGWGYNYANGPNASVQIPFATTNAYTSDNSLTCSIETGFASINNPANNATTPFDHHVLLSFGTTTLKDTSLNEYVFRNYNFDATLSALASSTTFKLTNASNANSVTKTTLFYCDLKYPHTFDFTSESTDVYSFLIPASSSIKTLVKTTNYTANTVSFVYDLTDKRRITTSHSGSNLQFNIQAGSLLREIYAVAESSIKNIYGKNIKAVTSKTSPSPGLFTDYSALEVDSAYLIVTHPSLWSEATNYKNYRQTSGHNAVLADINELYNQYSYGVEKHPSSIRGFCDFILNEWSTPAQYLFIIGKSTFATDYRKNASNYAMTLVPTIGHPASDNLFTAGLGSSVLEPAIPTGRLAAKNNSEVQNYLEKMKKYEEEQSTVEQTYEAKEWMKQTLFFAGGNGATQTDIYRSFVLNYLQIIKSPKFGGTGTIITKATTDVIQTDLAEDITDLINNGVSLITFFGHSSAQGFDISVDNPNTYTNDRKYPLIVANGCQSGNIFIAAEGSPSSSEQFIHAPNGAIGFIASVDAGYDNFLKNYSDKLFEEFSYFNYGNTVGKQMQAAVKKYTGNNPNVSWLVRNVCNDMTLHGDPALRVNYHKKPDYAVQNEDVFFTPNYVSTELDSFDVNVVITNLGRAEMDTFYVELTRILPNASPKQYTMRINGPYYKDTIVFTLPVDIANGVGQNQFQVRVDFLGEIDEISELNNDILFPSVKLSISSSDLVPIWPYNFAVVPSKQITLKASTGSVFAPETLYRFEFDTVNTYDSPALRTYEISSEGGVLTWGIDSTWISDSTVYFWRTTPYNNPSDPSWREHSFQYIKSKRGWGQAQFDQFKSDNLQYIEQNDNNHQFEFVEVTKTLTCQVIGNASTLSDWYSTSVRLNGEQMEYGVCWGVPGIYVMVFDPNTLEPWGTSCGGQNPENGNFGNSNNNCSCSGGVDYYFVFNPCNSMQQLRDFIANVDDGYYLLIYTAIRGNFSSCWLPSDKQALLDLGASEINNANDNLPYIFFTKKGDNATTEEVLGTFNNETITLSASMTNSANFGSITSPRIGPANNWGSLHLRQGSVESTSTDELSLAIYGEDVNGKRTLIDTINGNEIDELNLSSLVNASEYPFIVLKSNIKDDPNRTPGQFGRWQVLYDWVPEAAINQLKGYSFVSDTIQQGQELKFSVAVENVSDKDMDSLRVKYWIEDELSNIIPIDYPKQAPLNSGDILQDEISYLAKSFSGNCNFWMDVNPEDEFWQLEQYHFNNVARVPFYVEKDRTNPLLDVTFDGVHILNGDIVSPKPEILVTLNDENKFLVLDDTSDFSVYITDPNMKKTRIPFIDKSGSEILLFTEASLPDNKAKIEYKPIFKTDGVYTLSVQAKDRSGNESGDNDFEIQFEVINKSTITQVLNYPNPFSTSTRFVFTLTGADVPDYFRIQILTVSGKVVREITQDEFGTIRIGRNISEYAWDGTDEFGDPLANGVYLYRVISKINSEEIELRSTSADQFFKKGFGKMYLMR